MPPQTAIQLIATALGLQPDSERKAEVEEAIRQTLELEANAPPAGSQHGLCLTSAPPA